MLALGGCRGNAAFYGWRTVMLRGPVDVVAADIAVLHVAETLKGGIASYLDEILPFQVDHYGVGRVAVLVPVDQQQELKNTAGVKLCTFASCETRSLNVINMIRAMRRYLSEQRPALIHAHSTYAGVAVRVLARWQRFPCRVVYCAHGWAFDRDIDGYKRRLIEWIERLLAQWCHAVVCISKHDFQSACRARLPADKLAVILNAISTNFDAGEPPRWPAGCRRVVFVGRLDRQKGADIFVEAVRQLDPPVFAYIVGAAVVDSSDVTRLPLNIATTGWLPRAQIQAYLASADIVVVPSRWEGFGLVALEAMRAAKPVIASRVGGLVELVEDGVSGKLVEPGSVHDLVDALRTACREDWSARGEAGRQRFLHAYTADRLNRQLLEVYCRALDASGHYQWA